MASFNQTEEFVNFSLEGYMALLEMIDDMPPDSHKYLFFFFINI